MKVKQNKTYQNRRKTIKIDLSKTYLKLILVLFIFMSNIPLSYASKPLSGLEAILGIFLAVISKKKTDSSLAERKSNFSKTMMECIQMTENHQQHAKLQSLNNLHFDIFALLSTGFHHFVVIAVDEILTEKLNTQIPNDKKGVEVVQLNNQNILVFTNQR